MEHVYVAGNGHTHIRQHPMTRRWRRYCRPEPAAADPIQDALLEAALLTEDHHLGWWWRCCPERRTGLVMRQNWGMVHDLGPGC